MSESPSTSRDFVNKAVYGIDQDAEYDETGGQSIKKRRLRICEAPLGFTNATKASIPKFVDIHLRILRSLYQSSSLDRAKSTIGSKNDESSFYGHEIWIIIECFLRNRSFLFDRKRDAGTARNVLAEARRQVSEIASAQPLRATTTSLRSATFLAPTIHASPSSTFSSHGGKRLVQGNAAVTSPAAFHAKASQENASCYEPANFNVVANLLKHRHDSAESAFHLESGPYQALLTTTNAHIVAQQRKLYDIQQSLRSKRHQSLRELVTTNVFEEKSKQRNRHSTPSCPATLDDEPQTMRLQMADLECKIRLWSLLAQDLREAIAVDP